MIAQNCLELLQSMWKAGGNAHPSIYQSRPHERPNLGRCHC